MKHLQNSRFWEIDVLRGTAIVMMIIFHFLYDLNYFHFVSISLYTGPLLLYAYSIGTLFLLLVGISLTISYANAQKTLTKSKMFKKFLFRGLLVFGLGLIVTIVTWLYLKEGFVLFGVLHCIGISIILAYPFVRFRTFPLILGIIFIALGIFLKTLTFDFPWLLWLGFAPSDFYTVDYFPLFPWFGVVLIGVFLGNTFYPNGKRKFALGKEIRFLPAVAISYFGRHSLIIYLLHQPILFGIFSLISFL